MLLPVTLTIAAACAIVNLWLAARVSTGRVRGNIMMGDGGSAPFVALQRAHANFTEYAPFVLILMALIEWAGGSATWLWVLGGLFVAGRIAHPIGMSRPAPNPFRLGGIFLTLAVTALLAGWALALVYQGAPGRVIDSVPVEAPRG